MKKSDIPITGRKDTGGGMLKKGNGNRKTKIRKKKRHIDK